MESNLAASELERKKTLNENEAIKIEYQKNSRVVAAKQRKLTENVKIAISENWKWKPLKSLTAL